MIFTFHLKRFLVFTFYNKVLILFFCFNVFFLTAYFNLTVLFDSVDIFCLLCSVAMVNVSFSVLKSFTFSFCINVTSSY